AARCDPLLFPPRRSSDRALGPARRAARPPGSPAPAARPLAAAAAVVVAAPLRPRGAGERGDAGMGPARALRTRSRPDGGPLRPGTRPSDRGAERPDR